MVYVIGLFSFYESRWCIFKVVIFVEPKIKGGGLSVARKYNMR